MSELVQPSDPANPPACPHGCSGGSPVCGLCEDEGIWIEGPACQHGVTQWCVYCELEARQAECVHLVHERDDLARRLERESIAHADAHAAQLVAEQDRDTALAALAARRAPWCPTCQSYVALDDPGQCLNCGGTVMEKG